MKAGLPLALVVILAALSGRGSSPTPGVPTPPPLQAPVFSASPVIAEAAPTITPAPSSSALAPSPATPIPRPGMPKELIIPALHVDAPVERVGTTADGAMEAPREWNDVAWFELGYRPGELGSAVIAGHLDSSTDKAVFWDLHELKPGDKVIVKSDSSQLTFAVVDSATYPYDQAPLEKIFGPTDAPTLNLVTCNGAFDRGTKNYSKRLVVYTKEVASS